MKAELNRETTEYKNKKQFYNDIFLGFPTNESERAEKLLEYSKRRCEDLRAAIKREKHNLYRYIQGQERAVQSVKRLREKAKID